ncbi:hypothetical protein [Pseudomonas abietaniphila]
MLIIGAQLGDQRLKIKGTPAVLLQALHAFLLQGRMIAACGLGQLTEQILIDFQPDDFHFIPPWLVHTPKSSVGKTSMTSGRRG